MKAGEGWITTWGSILDFYLENRISMKLLQKQNSDLTIGQERVPMNHPDNSFSHWIVGMKAEKAKGESLPEEAYRISI